MSLTACSLPLVKPEYIKAEIPPVPVLPEMYDVRFDLCRMPEPSEGSCYCMDAENAKSLIKNILLLRSHDRQLTEILEGLKK